MECTCRDGTRLRVGHFARLRAPQLCMMREYERRNPGDSDCGTCVGQVLEIAGPDPQGPCGGRKRARPCPKMVLVVLFVDPKYIPSYSSCWPEIQRSGAKLLEIPYIHGCCEDDLLGQCSVQFRARASKGNYNCLHRYTSVTDTLKYIASRSRGPAVHDPLFDFVFDLSLNDIPGSIQQEVHAVPELASKRRKVPRPVSVLRKVSNCSVSPDPVGMVYHTDDEEDPVEGEGEEGDVAAPDSEGTPLNTPPKRRARAEGSSRPTEATQHA